MTSTGTGRSLREGDAVLMPSGFRSNVSVSGDPRGFLWAMAAHREGEDRHLAVLINMEQVEFVADHLNHPFRFRLHDGRARWYATAAWDQEDTEQRDVAAVNKQGAHFHPSALCLPDTVATRGALLAAVKDQSLRMGAPVILRILSNSNPPGG